MLRPLVFFDQEDVVNVNKDHEFLCGDHILACPVVTEGATSRQLYLPKGEWYHYYNNKKYQGAQEVTIATPLNEIPMFVQAGAVLPEYPVQQYTGEIEIEEVTLKVYFKDGEMHSQYYEDDHKTYGYENEDYALSYLQLNGSNDSLILTQTKEGTHDSRIKRYALQIIGLPFGMAHINIDNGGDQAILAMANAEGKIVVPAGFDSIVIK